MVATKTGKRINTELAIDTVKEAFSRSNIKEEIILHSDRGSQFTSKAFVKFCEKKSIIQSMGETGCPGDNSPMERFYGTLKPELIDIHTYHDDKTLESDIICYCYGWYNNLRPHKFNGGLPPLKVQ